MVQSEPDLDSRLDEITRQLEVLLEEVEERRRMAAVLAELSSDLSPLAQQGFATTTAALSKAEERGYIDFVKSGAGLVDKIVAGFTPEDVDDLGDNIVLILSTIKEMTQPELMGLMRSTIEDARIIEGPDDPPSLFALARMLRRPEARKGLFRLVSLLETIGSVNQQNIGKEATE